VGSSLNSCFCFCIGQTEKPVLKIYRQLGAAFSSFKAAAREFGPFSSLLLFFNSKKNSILSKVFFPKMYF